jgi:hypothetical protein
MSNKKKNVKRPLRSLEARDLMKANGGEARTVRFPPGALGFMPQSGRPVLGFVPSRPTHRPHHPVLGFVPSGHKGPVLGFFPTRKG